MWVVSQGQNTEFPKVYNSVNYTVDYRNVNVCRCITLNNIAYIIVYKGSHGDYNVNYVDQIITSTGANISVNYCSLQSCTPLEILCFGSVFVIAFVTDLANGNEPTIHKYDQAKIREHFWDYLSKNIMTPFPQTHSQYKKPHIEKLHIFCKCHFPDNGKEKMILSDTCNEWYHQSCEIVDSNLFKSKNTVWNCSKCIKYTF